VDITVEHDDIMENIYEKTFSIYLKKYVDEKSLTEGKGFISRLAKTLKTPQGQLSNVLRGERPGTETWRRFVAKTIGIEYDVMIGIKPESTSNQNNIKIINFPDRQKQKHPHHDEMHQFLDEIIDSEDTGLISAIHSNLKSFQEIVSLKKNVKNQQTTIDNQSKEIKSNKRDMKSMAERLEALEQKSG